jgi:uncharacterized membrane protein YeiH
VKPDLTFTLPLAFEYVATVLWALSGSLVAARRGYDIAGIVMIALISATGGGLLRDGIFINEGPPLVLESPTAVTLAVAVAIGVWLLGHRIDRIPHFATSIMLLDALGIGAFGLVGLQLSLAAGLSLPASVFVGVVNATGGEVLRDVLTRREPTIFKPGTPSALAALAGCLIFLLLVFPLRMDGTLAGLISVTSVFLIRIVSLRYDFRTRPALGYERDDERH